MNPLEHLKKSKIRTHVCLSKPNYYICTNQNLLKIPRPTLISIVVQYDVDEKRPQGILLLSKRTHFSFICLIAYAIFFFQWTWFFLWLFHSGIFFFFSFTWVDWLFSQVHLRYTYPSSKQMGPSLDKSNWSLGLKKELPFFTLQNNKFVNFARPLISNTTWPNRLGTLLFCIYSLLI